MCNSISRTIVAGLAALAMSAAVVLPATPASAAYRFGGWGGGWHGGGLWHPGYRRGGYWYNGWWGPAVSAGVLTGAAIATYPAWGYGYGRGGCWRPLFGRANFPSGLRTLSGAVIVRPDPALADPFL